MYISITAFNNNYIFVFPTVRTPPKYENAPFIPPLGNEATPIDNKPNQGEDPPPPSSAQPSELNRVQVLQIHSSDVQSSDKEPQQPKRDDRSSINVASHRVPPQQSDAQVGRRNQKRDRQGGGRGHDGRHGNGQQQQQQQARKVPSRDLIDEFMKPPTANVVSTVCTFLFLSLSLYLHECTCMYCTMYIYTYMHVHVYL